MSVQGIFRAKCKDDGLWTKGYLFKSLTKTYILLGTIVDDYGEETPIKVEVDPMTVTQFTGLQDNDGAEIFEGDIVEVWQTHADDDKHYKAIIGMGNPNGDYTWGWQLMFLDKFPYNKDILCWVGMEESGAYCKVVGNFWDNPELLKVNK